MPPHWPASTGPATRRPSAPCSSTWQGFERGMAGAAEAAEWECRDRHNSDGIHWPPNAKDENATTTCRATPTQPRSINLFAISPAVVYPGAEWMIYEGAVL